MVKVAILGFGTVGSGVYNVLNKNKDILKKRTGSEIEIKYVLDLREFPGNPVDDILTHDFNDILNDPEVKVVAEVMGGVKPAYDFTKQCLMAKKSVCTSNKELVAKHGEELLGIARENNVNYFFEASCGGGIPIIRSLNEALIADDIDEISGILNGTTNYILTKMSSQGLLFDDVLKDAQDMGYAERNPEADIEGYDAQRKIAILSSIAFGKTVDHESIYTEGITKITPADLEFAKEFDSTIKLIAYGGKKDGKYYAFVSPFMVGRDNPLYSVDGVFNAIFVHGNMLGDAMFYGSGAGSLPTASAVASDIAHAVKCGDKTAYSNWQEGKIELSPIDSFESRFFVRIEKSLKETAKRVFGDGTDFKEIPMDGSECAFVTDVMSEKEFEEKASKLSGIKSRIRCK
ncbi:MAG: homoserine dehydrogenase [Lachnospiraceae bacterium]|nr:homoserine dehydrogenase [Lachnospiraceae bacterium]